MTSTSVHQQFSGLRIVIGSLVFVCGGAFHPRINSSLGALGSTEFFQNFYMHIAHHGSWRLIHGMILAGPVLWLLGSVDGYVHKIVRIELVNLAPVGKRLAIIIRSRAIARQHAISITCRQSR